MVDNTYLSYFICWFLLLFRIICYQWIYWFWFDIRIK